MAGLGGHTAAIMTDSCRGIKSCYQMGFSSASGISIVSSSCVGTSACENVGRDNGGVDGLIGSCNAEKACWNAGETGARVISQSMWNCCNTFEECKDASQATIPATCQVCYDSQIVLLLLFKCCCCFCCCCSVGGAAGCGLVSLGLCAPLSHHQT